MTGRRHSQLRTGRHAVSAARSLRRRGALMVAGILASVMVASGSAYAYWTGIGGGSGTASTDSPQAVTLLQATGAVTNGLAPGGTSDLRLQLANPNAYAVTVVSVQQAVGSVVVTSASGTCTVTGVSVPTNNALSISVASGTTVTIVVPNGAAMSTASDNGCQGATFRIPVTVAVRR